MLDLIKKIEETRALYQETADTKPAREAEPIARQVKELQQQLADAIADGAVPCAVRYVLDRDKTSETFEQILCVPGCGGSPHGIMQPNGFELGCLACGDARPRVHRKTRGFLREQAVEAWNAEQAVEPDGKPWVHP